MFPIRFKVAFVAVLSCLALVLGLFSPTGVASANHSQAVQSQVSASTAVDQDQSRSRCRTFVLMRERFNRFEDEDTGRFFDNETFFNGRHGIFVFGRHGREFHPVFTRLFERIVFVTICHGHRSERTEIHPF